MTATDTTEFLTSRQVSDWLQLPMSTLHDLRIQGRGPTSTVFSPRNVRYKRADVEAWIETCRRTTPAAR